MKAAARIVAYLEKDAVLVDGGWRYAPKEWRSDTSVTCWVLQAFDAARNRDVPVDDGVLYRGLDFLARARRPDGHATYTEYEGGGPQLTAASLLARLLFATEAPDVVNDELSAALAKALKPVSDLAADPRRRKDAAAALWSKWPNEYGWYYVTYALAKRPGEAWDRWRPVVESALTTHQVAEGHLAGTWAPGNFQWAKTCGRCYVTAMNALTLAAVYRHEGVPR